MATDRYIAAGVWTGSPKKVFHQEWDTGDALLDPDGNPLGGVVNFTALGDTPSTYSGQDGLVVTVDEFGVPGGQLIFAAGGGGGGTLQAAYDFGGSGVGRQIVVASGLPVHLAGAGDFNALHLDDTQWIAMGTDLDSRIGYSNATDGVYLSTAEKTGATSRMGLFTGYVSGTGAQSGHMEIRTGDSSNGGTGNIWIAAGVDEGGDGSLSGFVGISGRIAYIDTADPNERGVAIGTSSTIPEWTQLYIDGNGILRLKINASASANYEEDGNIRFTGTAFQGYVGGAWEPFTGGGGGADSDWLVNVNNMSSIPIGNVGIGDTTPEEKLTVVGGIKLSGTPVQATAGTIRLNGTILQGYSTAWHNLTQTPVNLGDQDLFTSLDASGNPQFKGLTAGTGIGLATVGSNVVITNTGGGGAGAWTDAGTWLYPAGSEWVHIGSTGDPGYPLRVTGHAYITQNVGIGTIPASDSLTVNGAVKIGTTGTTINGTVRYTGSSSPGGFQGYNGGWVNLDESGGGTSFWARTTDRIYPTTISDDVVIGATTMSGSEKLRVWQGGAGNGVVIENAGSGLSGLVFDSDWDHAIETLADCIMAANKQWRFGATFSYGSIELNSGLNELLLSYSDGPIIELYARGR